MSQYPGFEKIPPSYYRSYCSREIPINHDSGVSIQQNGNLCQNSQWTSFLKQDFTVDSQGFVNRECYNYNQRQTTELGNGNIQLFNHGIRTSHYNDDFQEVPQQMDFNIFSEYENRHSNVTHGFGRPETVYHCNSEAQLLTNLTANQLTRDRPTATLGSRTITELTMQILPPESKQTKRIRTAFTTQQLEEFEKEYARSRYADRKRRMELSAKFNLNERSVKIWFQNRRMKEKRVKQENEQDDEVFPDSSEDKFVQDEAVYVNGGYPDEFVNTALDTSSIIE